MWFFWNTKSDDFVFVGGGSLEKDTHFEAVYNLITFEYQQHTTYSLKLQELVV